jgi:hypothetical protein
MKWITWSVLACSLTSSLYYLPDISPAVSTTYLQQEQNSPTAPIQSSNWVATDAVGRTLPTVSQTGSPRKNKYVGIFYLTWHGAYEPRTIYDVTKILKTNPTNPQYGPRNAFHWWGEPEVGYYRADDPWIIRRNLQLLMLAGIDILFLDATNGDIYLPVVKKLCEISISMRKSGMPTPYICFITNTNGAQTVMALYQQIYAPGLYSDLWFGWQGKPLILGKVEEMTDPTIRNFFTWRYSWEFTDAKNQPNHWQWLDNTPQNYGWHTNPNVPEEIPVASASLPVFGVGKSNVGGRSAALNRYKVATTTGQGLHFAEQWKRALTVNPSVVFVTSWNEWIAQRYIADTTERTMLFKHFVDHKMKQGETFFQDSYNEEYNRDIEPMKGGYTDNYYYQLVSNIRRFKGMPAPDAASPARTIPIDGKFTEWTTIKPAYMDPKGDVLHRNWLGADNKIRYVNNTGRNDITDSHVAYDTKNAYFHAKTAKKLTPSTGKNWMLLFIDTDQSAKTGWAGYDFLINQTIKGNQTSISHWNGKAWQAVGTGSLRYAGNELELSIPLSSIRQTSGKVQFDFHWADNIQKTSTITEFFLNGDSAPDRRFNYRYVSK